MRSRGVTRKPFRIVWNGFRATRYRSQPHHLHRWSVPLPRLRHVPTWLRSVSASSVLSADPQGCTLVCLASPGQSWPHSIALCHLLSTDVVSCWTRRSSRAPGILALKLVRLSAQSPAGCRACTARTLWGAGVEVRVPLLSQMCPAGVLGPTSEPAGPSMRVSPSELRGRSAASLMEGDWGIVRPYRGWSVSAGPGWSPSPFLTSWFHCHRPSPHAQHARRPVLTWDSQVVH